MKLKRIGILWILLYLMTSIYVFGQEKHYYQTDFTKEDFAKIMTVDREPGKQELLSHEELFERMYDKLPKEFFFMRELLLSALWRSPEHWGLQPERN